MVGAVHLLECTHSLNSRSQIDYLMYCNVLKTMSDGRLKVYVLEHGIIPLRAAVFVM